MIEFSSARLPLKPLRQPDAAEEVFRRVVDAMADSDVELRVLVQQVRETAVDEMCGVVRGQAIRVETEVFEIETDLLGDWHTKGD